MEEKLPIKTSFLSTCPDAIKYNGSSSKVEPSIVGTKNISRPILFEILYWKISQTLDQSDIVGAAGFICENFCIESCLFRCVGSPEHVTRSTL